ncbi:MAG TPA: hypothetical protein VM219_02810 [Phycisphaerae bacterium]|nr:hypothetical protein [Phycisphaerae bacterium]
MAIEFQCECGAAHSAEESMAGQTFTCDECSKEITVPAAGSGADELVAQMRQAAERSAAPGAAGEIARAIQSGAGPKAPPAPPRDRRARAATHLKFKKVAWIPALVVGIVCAAFGLGCIVSALTVEPEVPELTTGQGRWGPIFEDERGDKYELVEGPDGRKWFIAQDAEKLEWKDGRPIATQQGWDLKVVPAETSHKFRAWSAATDRAATHSERLGVGYLIFGAAFLVVGPVLIFLALWMRRDIRLLAAKEENGGSAAE